MFDLMAAIRIKQERKAPPPAETADSAETAQPRGLELAENLRKVADFPAEEIFSATIRKNPQTEKTSKPPSTLGFGGISAIPQNPQTPADNKGQNPDALLLEIAQTLQASPARLRALLSDDDMQDIAEDAISRSHLLAYFRLMRSDGHPLANDSPEPTRAPESRPRHLELMQAWKPAHDALINHLMACDDCHAPHAHYCEKAAELRRSYDMACEIAD
ncbi:hypothetical protein [uncultured Marinobacter sp.]|jgi:hypothetical protein|uniref:hypothetical protein n=1 Tax=uncultured Marinobacter sp. TaxID=187379 RepID=UPI00258C837D|nr:hypothetical protein [uncultured Marinobacter sp.]|tara:strand:+ start:138 stop:788 length:651 start_codon:yes stop_codon:yes gene_type:complete